MDYDINDTAEHEDGEYQEMQPVQRRGQSLVVAGEAEAEEAFGHPAAGHQHEAALGFRQLDHLQAHAVCGHVRGRSPPARRKWTTNLQAHTV